MRGLEPPTFCMASRRSSQLSYIRSPSEYRGGIASKGRSRLPLTLPHRGDVAEWLRGGLQSPSHRFDSGRRLHGEPSELPPLLSKGGIVPTTERAPIDG